MDERALEGVARLGKRIDPLLGSEANLEERSVLRTEYDHDHKETCSPVSAMLDPRSAETVALDQKTGEKLEGSVCVGTVRIMSSELCRVSKTRRR